MVDTERCSSGCHALRVAQARVPLKGSPRYLALSYMWASYLNAIRLTLVWDRRDLAGLERMAHVCRTRSLLHPYGMTDHAACWRALMLV